MGDSPDLDLWFDGVLVGHIREPFQSDGTWFDILERAVQPSDSELPRRLSEFIRFCEDWNERVRDDSADAAEFDSYADVVKSGLWVTIDSVGRSTRIADAPVFFSGDEVTWAFV
jgi:hypothetical protein